MTGPLNLITDVAGLRVGNAEDIGARTGVTVLLADTPAVGAADIRGGAPGSRETALLDPDCLVEGIDALVLSGGSAFGLAAADGAAVRLAALGRGFAIGQVRVPIVPAAILFDLTNGGDKEWGEEPPYHALGRAAVDAAGLEFRLGNAGAGLGAKAGTLKGGLGSTSMRIGGWTVGALVAANPIGSVTMPGSGTFWAWSLEQAGELGGQYPPAQAADLGDETGWRTPQLAAATTIAVVATDAALTKAQARRLAIMAQDGLARAIRPVHTPFDGDSVFALATGRGPAPDAVGLMRLGLAAADCLARAVARGVFEAESLGDHPAYRSRHRAAFGKQGERA